VRSIFWLNSSYEPLASRCPTAAASMRAGCLPAKVNTIDESLPAKALFPGLGGRIRVPARMKSTWSWPTCPFFPAWSHSRLGPTRPIRLSGAFPEGRPPRWPLTRFHHQLDAGTPKTGAAAADIRPALRLLRLLLFTV